MAGKGSNDLNMLLKAQVVKIRAELDIPKSMPKIRKQVDEISKKLENKPVKLKVELDSSITNLNSEIKKIKTKIETSKTFKPLKLKVEIDVAGSATQIKKQLQDVYRTMADFNKKYGDQIKKMNEQTVKGMKNVGGSTDGNVMGFDYKKYVSQIDEAKRYMKKTFGDGNFASFQTKDAQGNLTGFIAQLEKANGVVQKINYQWDKDAKTFSPIQQQTIDTIERNVHKATQSLRSMYAEIERLNKGAGRSSLFKEYNRLDKASSRGEITQDEVKALQTMIKQEQVLQQEIKQENDLLFQRKKLIQDIAKAQRSIKNVNNREQFNDKFLQARNAKTLDDLRNIRLETNKLTDTLQRQDKKQMESQQVLKKRIQLTRELQQLEKTVSSGKGGRNKEYIQQSIAIAKAVRSTEDLVKAQKRLDNIKSGKWAEEMDRKISKSVNSVREKLETLREKGGITQASFNRHMDLLARNSQKSLGDVNRQLDQVTAKLKQKEKEIKAEANKIKTLLSGDFTADANTRTQYNKVKSAIDSGDIAQIEKYMGQLYKGRVETVKMEDATDKMGRAVTRLKVKMAGAGKTVESYTVDLDRANKQLRETAQGTDYNANRNLGVFEQLKIAMARVPVWMASMTAFYGTLRGLQNVGREILLVDQSLTELKRVADDGINIDRIFQGSMDLAKNLGNDIHSVMQTMNDFARTFGDFNERQLLQITETATLMSNVSELTAQEAGETLIGTMNAFGIMADESIRIADSMNEVDNNFAVSTKQLAEGMAKGASTAKTFGVSMEESIGHITAISSVTMESGRIIGNSLKTIYSRITTLGDARGVLEEVGVKINDMEGNVRPVNDILADLAGRWGDLTDQERQNISVKVAGRYQLSRFLALMNNWQTATEATATALTSEGSAMKENARYMESFEARINKLKNAFTEMALAMGDAFLSGAMMAGIDGLTKLAEVATTVAKEIGMLPVALGAVGSILGMVFAGKIRTAMAGVSVAFKQASADAVGFRGVLTGVGASGKVAMAGLATAIRGVGTVMKSMLASTGIGLVFVGVGILIEKLVAKFNEQKRVQEEVKKSNEAMVDSYRNTEGGLKNLVERYNDLQSKVDNKQIKEGTEAYNEYLEVNQQVAKALPSMVKYVDSKGVAHMQEADAMLRAVDVARELSKAQAELTKIEFTSNIKEQSESIKDLTEDLVKLAEKRDRLIKTNGRQGVTNEIHSSGRGYKIETLDNSKAIQENVIQAQNAYMEIQKVVQQLNLTITETTMASLEASGDLANLTDTQKRVVERLISTNEAYFQSLIDDYMAIEDKSAEDLEKLTQDLQARAEKVMEAGTRAGELISKKVKEMTKGVADTEEIDKINQSLDNLFMSMPDTFFKPSMINDIDKFEDHMNKVLDIGEKIKNGDGNFDGLVKDIEKLGFETEEAESIVTQLGFTFDNQAIKAEAMARAQDGTNESLEEYKDIALEVIDISTKLFGYGDEDVQALKSHIDLMQVMIQTGEKNAEMWDDSRTAIADYFLKSEDYVEKNIGKFTELINLMSSWSPEFDENNKLTDSAHEKFHKIQQLAKDLDIELAIDAETGEIVEATNKMEENTESKKKNEEQSGRTKDADKDMKDQMGRKPNDPLLDEQYEKVNPKIDEAKAKDKELKDQIGTPPPRKPIDETLYDPLGLIADNTKGKDEELKNQLATAPRRPEGLNTFFDPLNLSGDRAILKDAEVKNKVSQPPVPSGKWGSIYEGINTSANNAKTKDSEVKSQVSQAPVPSAKWASIYNPIEQSASNAKRVDSEFKQQVSEAPKVPEAKWRAIYDEVGSSSDANLEKVNKLKEAISNANSGADILGILGQMLDTAKTKARETVAEIDKVGEAFGRIGSNTSGVTNMATSMNRLKDSASQIQSVITGAMVAVNSFGGRMTAITGQSAGAMSALRMFAQTVSTISPLTSMSNTNLSILAQRLMAVSSMARLGSGALSTVANSFRNASVSVRTYSTALSNSARMSGQSAQASRNNVGAKSAEVQAYARVTASLKNVSTNYTSTAKSATTATARVRSAIAQHQSAILKLQSIYKGATSRISGMFSAMSSVVASRTNAMIGRHEAQRSAINRLADSARSAKRDIDNMVSSARNAMSSMSRYIAKANQAKSAGNSVPRAPRATGFMGFGLGTTPNNTPSEGVANAMSAFSASAEGVAGGDGGAGSGTSGVIQPSINEMGHYELFQVSERADAYDIDYFERRTTYFEGQVGRLEAKAQRITKLHRHYRDTLAQIIKYNNIILKSSRAELDNTIKRNNAIEKRIKALGSVSSHTEKEREEYNKLQQEYDSNISKIASLKKEVEGLVNDIKSKTEEMFVSFIDEIGTKYENLMRNVRNRIDDLDFRIEVLEITDPENLTKQIEALQEKAIALAEEEATMENKAKHLHEEYKRAIEKYGWNSAQAKYARDAYEEASNAYQDAHLETLRAEKEIRDIRAEIADDGIEQLKDYYNEKKDMALEAIDIEKRELEKAHEEKMEMYDEEIDRINSVYDEKLKAMDKEKDQAEYQEELDEKNAQKAELVNKISLLSRDNSLEGRKKVEELKKELAEVEKDISDFMKERQDELLRDSIEEQKQAQIDELNAKKEAEKETYEGQVGELDKEKETISKHYEDLLNDEQYWADMRNNYIEGSFTQLTSSLLRMSADLSRMQSGNFDSLTSGFKNMSDEIKREFAELNNLTIDNMQYGSRDVIDNAVANGIYDYAPYEGEGKSFDSPVYTSVKPTESNTSKDKEKKDPNAGKKGYKQSPTTGEWVKDDDSFRSNDLLDPNRGKTGYVQAEDGSWMKKDDTNRKTTSALNFRSSPKYGKNIISVLPKGAKVDYLGMESGWAKIKYNGKTGYVGSRYLKKFDTGGYTGDWAGNDGKVAMLHKKEQVFHKDDTKNLLDASKILRALKDKLPQITRSSIGDKFATASTIVNNVNYGDIIVTVEGGNKKKSKDIATEIIDGIKKRGK